MAIKSICAVAWATLLAGCPLAFAGPMFKNMTFGKQFTHCDASSTHTTTAPDGSAFSILFNQMQVQAGTKQLGLDRIRWDEMRNLASPL